MLGRLTESFSSSLWDPSDYNVKVSTISAASLGVKITFWFIASQRLLAMISQPKIMLEATGGHTQPLS